MNSTIKPKKKSCVCGCGREGYIFSKGMLKECWSRVYGKPIKRVSDKRLNKDFSSESYGNLMKDVDAVYSKYIRVKYSNIEGIVECYTCNFPMRWEDAHNGHCIGRASLGTRYMELNTRVQCPYCNSKHETHPEIFRNKLEQERAGTLEYLDEVSRSINKLTVSDLKELLIEYKEKLKLVMSKLENK